MVTHPSGTLVEPCGDVVPLGQVVPVPVSVSPDPGVTFVLSVESGIYAAAGWPEAHEVASYLAGLLRPATGFRLPVMPAGADTTLHGIALLRGAAPAGPQGYELDVAAGSAVIRAQTRAGLLAGVQTLRQLLPAKVESKTVREGPWAIQGGHILDYPRYPYRGVMLDVARHYFPVEAVKKYVDEVARYKINYLHLHLTDDQGWRITIDSWPQLTVHGGSTGAGGFQGGSYTKDDYRAVVEHAWSRGITVIPEVEGPAHSRAALASYAELNHDGRAPDIHTGFGPCEDGVLSIRNEVTYRFLDDVIGEIAAMTPGPYIHIGADEAHHVPHEDYAYYVGRVASIVAEHGKKVFSWQEALNACDPASATAHYWIAGVNDAQVIDAARRGAKIVMAPSKHCYLDMRYTESEPPFPVGHTWAGCLDVDNAYGWQPDTILPGLPPEAIVGVAAPLWSEFVYAIDHIEQLTFPRLLAIAEIGWSAASTHDWDSFRLRVAAQGPRLRRARINYFLSAAVPWPDCS